MKTRAMKKVLSVVCVLALLMSVCVVALVGTTSAAETYTLNVNGNTETIDLEAGAAIPAPEAPYEFLGWYDSLKFDTKVEVAGEAKTLYAKFNSVVLDFENDGWAFKPNGGQAGNYQVVTDPTNANNKAIKFPIGVGRNNFGVPTYVGSNEGYTFVQGQQYEIAFDYYVDGNDTFNKIGVAMMTCEQIGVGKDGGNKTQDYASVSCPDTAGGWQHASQIITGTKITDINKFLVFTAYIGSAGGYSGTVLFDNITVTPVSEKDYTFYNKGEKTEYTLTPGAALPVIKGSSFKGWYDSSLTVKYDVVPATVTKLFAKHVKVLYDFETEGQIFDPLGNFGTNGHCEFAEDGENTSVKINAAKDKRRGFAVAGAFYANAGYTITKGQVYTVNFRYKADNAISYSFYTAADANIGINGGKEALGWTGNLEAASDWTAATAEFVLSPESTIDLTAMENLFLTVYNGSNDVEFYIDDLAIAPKAPKVSAEDVVMDFENDFKWSVADANNYTTSSGNGYVNRGEIVEEADGNHYFRLKHFLKRNANIYFTVDNGTTHFSAVNGGIYTIEFDYKVEHSETPSTIGLLYAKPTTESSGLDYETLVEFDTFENRDDEDWTHVTYTFYANYEKIACTSLGLYVYNSTNVPETNVDTGVATATSVLFDNIVITTHSNTGDDGLIIFDSLGGTDCTPIVGEGESPVGVLPEPTKYGYVFKGWEYYTEGPEGTVTVPLTATSLMPYDITEAYAVWELAEGVVELEFKTNVPSYDEEIGKLVAFPGQPIIGFPTENPTSTTSQFIGWFYDTAFTKPVDKNVAPAESSIIYAKWTNAGMKFDFENMPVKDKDGTPGVYATDRIKIKELEDGNHVVFYNFSIGSNQSNTSGLANIMLYDGVNYATAIEGLDYTVTFKYKVLEAKASGAIGSVLSQKGSAWGNRQEQTGRMNYGSAEDKWLEGSYTFTAAYAADTTSNNNFISIGCSNDCKIYIDDVVVTSSINNMNIYGSAVIFNTNGGKVLDAISGLPGSAMKLPTPSKPGYKFMGWYTDKALTTPYTATVFGEEQVILYAKWQLGKFAEDFEEFPSTVKSLGIAGAYSFYTSKTAGFDATNIHGGETSLFRNGATAGVKNFTCMRSKDLALTVGETYTLSFYVKPTSIGDANGTISLLEMATFTGINQGTIGDVVAKVSDLKEGEWNLVTFTFTAKSEFIGISTTASNDMYFDDLTVTLKGYTGSANTGDASVNPILVIALVLISAGALLVTGKKVFSK